MIPQQPGELPFVPRRTQVNPSQVQPTLQEVHVGIVETGQDEPAARVHDSRVPTDRGRDLAVRTDDGDAPAGDANRLSRGPGGVAGPYPRVDDGEL